MSTTSAKPFPIWGFFLLVTNGILMLAIVVLIIRQHQLTHALTLDNYPEPTKVNPKRKSFVPELGPRHQLSYQKWQNILKQEAQVVAEKPPEKLTILAGDSLSLWFPPDLLPQDRNWLNQGISGETSEGLFKRLNYFDQTKPEIIFVMIGINDLLRGISDKEILRNQQKIISYLRRKHPNTKIFLQSILPHSAEQATWEGKDKLLEIPNSRIRKINQELQKIAEQEGVTYLNLYSLLSNETGDLSLDFTTDGLHLNPQGYTVWRTALQIYSQQTTEPKQQKIGGNRI